MRRKVTSAIQLTSWDEVNDTLRQIGEHQRDIAATENVMNEQIANAKTAAEAKAAPLREGIKMLELAIREFATGHRKDMGKLKSKALTFGVVSFRQSTKVSLPAARSKLDAIIEKLLERGMRECVVRPEPRVDKNALKKYKPDEIIAVGASIQTDETFGYEIDATKIADV